MEGFEYPAKPHIRRHGPAGYTDYTSYRDWLRDEFTFRCVYCLHREQWYNRGATFHVEHSVPVSVHPERKCDYTNLLYACATCNEAKNSALGVPNPCDIAFQDCLRIKKDGRVEARNDDGQKLIDVLRLDNQRNVRERARWIRILGTARTRAPKLYEELMGFPEELPDLRRKRVPINTKPEGVQKSCFALRKRGELPTIY